jgi:biopolymer transport protein ExbD
MRRFSQRNSLVTLSEINITPLLDLAFVLLIIFIITTPLLEQSVKMDLPTGGQESREKPRKEDIATVEITREGDYVLHKKQIAFKDLEQELSLEFKRNPKLGVVVRGDKESHLEKGVAVMDACERLGIQKFRFQTRNSK